MTVREYAQQWLQIQRATVRKRTYTSYELSLRRHILPGIGDTDLKALTRHQIRVLIAGFMVKNARTTAAFLLAVLRTMLTAALEDGLIDANPAMGIGRSMRLTTFDVENVRKRALTSEQLGNLLDTAKRTQRKEYPAFLLYASTGMRLGEGLGLQWDDVDFQNRGLSVRRQVNNYGEMSEVKTRRGRRRVDLGRTLSETLMDLKRQHREEALRLGRKPSAWVLYPWRDDRRTGVGVARKKLTRALNAVLKTAGIEGRFTIHGFRHTFASLLIQQGKSPAYVQAQLGHASISTTVDVYGSWDPERDPSAIDELMARSTVRQMGLDLGGKKKA